MTKPFTSADAVELARFVDPSRRWEPCFPEDRAAAFCEKDDAYFRLDSLDDLHRAAEALKNRGAENELAKNLVVAAGGEEGMEKGNMARLLISAVADEWAAAILKTLRGATPRWVGLGCADAVEVAQALFPSPTPWERPRSDPDGPGELAFRYFPGGVNACESFDLSDFNDLHRAAAALVERGLGKQLAVRLHVVRHPVRSVPLKGRCDDVFSASAEELARAILATVRMMNAPEPVDE